MLERINDKINLIEKFIEELSPMIPENLEDYIKDFRSKAACERYFEKIVEAIIDLAFLIIRYKKLKMPEDDESSFIILSKENLISEQICNKFRQAKSMRNIIIHQYGEIDDIRVFNSLKYELINDVEEFIRMINKNLNNLERER